VAALCISLLALTAALAFSATPASAAQTRLLETSFGPDGTAATAFEQPSALGIDQSTGSIYVADVQAQTVQKLNSAHEPEAFTGIAPDIVAGKLTGFTFEPRFTEIAVNSATHDFYLTNGLSNGTVRAYQSDGEPANFTAGPGAGTNEIAGFKELCGVAVDSSGDIYASEFAEGANSVRIFAPSGELLTTISGARTCQLAVDSHGTVYISLTGPVQKLTPSEFPVTHSTTYTAAGILDQALALGVAVDPTTDHVFVDEHTRIAEYDASGSRLAVFGAEGPGALSASEGVAVNSASGRIYASDAEGERQVETFGPLVFFPDATTGGAASMHPTSAIVHGTVNPNGVPLTACEFEYLSDATLKEQFGLDFQEILKLGFSAAQIYGLAAAAVSHASCENPDAGELSGSIPVAVHSNLSGLQEGVTYNFRLATANANGSGDGEDQAFTTTTPLTIDAAEAKNLSATAADLTAKINPDNGDTTYRFEYGTSTAYGTTVPVPDADIGEGTTDVAVSQHIQGLTANTTYHWRISATNTAGATTSTDHTFIYNTAGGGLPDGRRYEMVTPPFKNGSVPGAAQVLSLASTVAEDGSRLMRTNIQCFGEAPSCPALRGGLLGTFDRFERTPAGWVATALAPSATQFEENTAWGANSDTNMALFSMATTPLGAEDLYVREPTGAFTDVGQLTEPGKAANPPGRTTPNFSHVLFSLALGATWSFDATKRVKGIEGGVFSLYEAAGTAKAPPHLVGVTGGAGSTDLISSCATYPGAQSANEPSDGYAVSKDGSTVFFTAAGLASGECLGSGANAKTPVLANTLYARINGSETIEISGHASAGCGTTCQASIPADAAFQGASTDGSKVFFTSSQQLTDQATEGTGSATGSGCAGGAECNVYEAELGKNELTGAAEVTNTVAISAGDSSGGGPRVQGVMATSPDGSHVYFVAQGELTNEERPGCKAEFEAAGQQEENRCKPTNGANNLYTYEQDAHYPHGRLSFVATLSSDSGNGPLGLTADQGQWQESGGGHANVTPEGRYLVFFSDARLTADDTAARQAQQVFRYDASTGALARISIGERGFNDNGNAASADAHIAYPKYSGGEAGALRSNPTMSNDGAYVFFMSPVGLTPQALNEAPIGGGELQHALAENIYEYHEGHVYLISDGHDTAAERTTCTKEEDQKLVSTVCLVGSDATGRNVFFTTADPLVPADTDTQLDVYDARICGAQPCIQAAAAPSPECSEEACHGTPAAIPLAPGVPSASFNGAGNISPKVSSSPKPKAVAQTRAEKLAKALTACRRKHNKHKRALCKRQASKVYGAKRASRTTTRASNHRRAGR
jgi:hypothetical protein